MARLRARHSIGGPLHPPFMEEGDWIDMTRVPLIITKGATARTAPDAILEESAEDKGAKTGQADEAEHAVVVDRPDEAEHATPVVENHKSDAEHVVEAEHAVHSVDVSSGADLANTEDTALASPEQMEELVIGSTGVNADDEEHAAELELALLAASSPDREANGDADPAETHPPLANVTTAEVCGVEK